MDLLKRITIIALLSIPAMLHAQPQARTVEMFHVTTPYFVRTFTGTIGGKLPIVMKLRRNNLKLSGWYYYSKGEKFFLSQSKPLFLDGVISTGGDFSLEEYDESVTISGLLKGAITVNPGLKNPPFEILGTWQKDSASPRKHLQLVQQHFMLNDTAALVETDLHEEGDLYSLSLTKPYITRGFKTEVFFKTIDEIITLLVEGFKKQALDVDVTDSMTVEILKTSKSGLDGSYDVMYAEKNLLSLRFTFSEYFAGAAHPSNFSQTLNYDLSTDNTLTLSDVFKNEESALKAFSDFARKEFLKRKISDKEWITTGTEPLADNFRNWNITPDGILVTFDAYQVASYAEGPQEVLVPYSVLKNLVKANSPVKAFLKK